MEYPPTSTQHSEAISSEDQLESINQQHNRALPLQITHLYPYSNPHSNPEQDNDAAPAHHDSKEDSATKLSQWTTKWIIDWWGIEIACWFTAVVSLVAMVIFLECYKNRPVPEWSFGITINSYISILSQVGQMAMMQPVVECISQLKWLWFARKKKLSNFQAFDDASRGPMGSLLFFWRIHGVHLVTLGAAITIVSAAFGPFSQQVVTYPLHLHPVGNASTPQVFTFAVSPLDEGEASPATLESIDEGLATGNFSLSTIPPSCSTGNCSFTEYSSLGVCSSVTELSSTIIHHKCNLTAFQEIFDSADIVNPGYPCFNYTLPKKSLQPLNRVLPGVGLEGQLMNATLTNAFADVPLTHIPMEIMSVTPSLGKSSGSVRTLYLMWQPGFSTSVNTTLSNPIAFELDFHLCIQTYNTTVSNGVTNTSLLSSRILETDVEQIYFPSSEATFYNSSDSYISIGGDVFGISNVSLNALSNTLATSYAVCYQLTGEEDQQFFCDSEEGYPFLRILQNSTDPYADITQQWHNMAISITNTFRSGAGGDTKVGQFRGTAYAPIAFVETNYLWLILPISLVSFTLIFLLATIHKSQRLGSRVWKSSNLATLQGLHGKLHTRLGGLISISEMEKNISNLEVRFNLDMNSKAGDGAGYSLVESKQKPDWRG